MIHLSRIRAPRLALVVFRKELAEIVGSKATVALIVMQPVISMIIFVLASNFSYRSIAQSLLGITLPPGQGEESYSAYAASAVTPLILLWVTTTLSSLSIVGESVRGTLDRIRASRIPASSVVLGKVLAFTLLAIGQAVILIGILEAFQIEIKGSISDLLLISVIVALIGVEWGLLYSAFSSTEVQAIQLVPPSIIPQILLCGIVWPRDAMGEIPKRVSDFLPMTYAVDAFRKVIIDGTSLLKITDDMGYLTVYVVVFAVLNLLALKNRLAMR